MKEATLIWWLSPEDVLDIVHRLDKQSLFLPRPLERVIRNLDEEDPSDYNSRALLAPADVTLTTGMDEVVIPPDFGNDRVGIFVAVEDLIALHQAGGLITNLSLQEMAFMPCGRPSIGRRYEPNTFFCWWCTAKEADAAIDATDNKLARMGENYLHSDAWKVLERHLDPDKEEPTFLETGIFSAIEGISGDEFISQIPYDEHLERIKTQVGVVIDHTMLSPIIQAHGTLTPCFRTTTVTYALQPVPPKDMAELPDHSEPRTKTLDRQGTRKKFDEFPLEANGLSYTETEIRQMFINHARSCIDYWDEQYVSGKIKAKEAISGVVHSLLAAIDGSALALPGFMLIANPHQDDEAHELYTGRRPFPYVTKAIRESLVDIGGELAYGLYNANEPIIEGRNHITRKQWDESLRTGTWTFQGEVMIKDSEWFYKMQQDQDPEIIPKAYDEQRKLCHLALECDLFFVEGQWDLLTDDTFSFKFATNDDEKLAKFIKLTDLPIRCNF